MNIVLIIFTQDYELDIFWMSRDSRNEKITRDDFTYSESGDYHNAASYWDEKVDRKSKNIEKPFEDRKEEFQKRLDAYEAKIRGIGLYKEEDIKSMMIEQESYVNFRLNEEWKKYEKSMGT